MTITATCRCGKKYVVRDELAGRRAKCRACGQAFTVPKPQQSSGGSMLEDLDPDNFSLAPSEQPTRGAAPSGSSNTQIDVKLALILGGGVGAAVVFAAILLVVLSSSDKPATEPGDVAQAVGVGEASKEAPGKASPTVPDKSPTAPDKSPTAPAKSKATPKVKRAQQFTVPVNVTTNVHGVTIVVRDANTKEQVHEVTLEGGKRQQQFRLQGRRTYDFEAQIAGEVTVQRGLEARAGQKVVLNFDSLDVREIARLAACMIKTVEGGTGTGFLFGDRQTVVTAAHVLATRRVEETKLIFDPDEEDEMEVTGSRLIYFDSQLDVAVVRLAEPVDRERPFLWRAERRASDGKQFKGQPDVIVVGNPGRGDTIDPMHIRTAKIVAGRPDEFQLDIELIPGFSGGPVCMADSGLVAGLVSYKITNSMAYKDVGKSFAKSVNIADDALTSWGAMSPKRRQAKIKRLADRFARQYGYRCAVNAGMSIVVDSAVYTGICMGVVQDYKIYMAEARFAIHPQSRNAVVRSKLRRAHTKFLRERAPKTAKKVRERVSPRLRRETKKWYERAMADEVLPQEIKDELKLAYESYVSLKEAAEKLVDSSGDAKSSKTMDEFLEWVTERWEDANSYGLSVVNASRGRLG